jgi:Flp pilus assembly protein TadG
VRWRNRGDAGSSVVEVAVLLPLMLLLLMAVVQLGLWFHVRAVMTTAANKGLDAARVDGGTTGEGQRAAEEFLAKTEALDGVSVDVERGVDSASVQISGDVVSLVFGWPMHVRVAVEAPVEQVSP